MIEDSIKNQTIQTTENNSPDTENNIAEIESEERLGYTYVHEQMLTPQGRVELWQELRVEYVAPVEKKGIQEGYSSFKEYAKSEPLVKRMRKECNKLGSILREYADADIVPTAIVMRVAELFVKINTLQEVILEQGSKDTLEVDKVTHSDTLDKVSLEDSKELMNTKRNREQSVQAEKYERNLLTAEDYGLLDDEGIEAGFEKTIKDGEYIWSSGTKRNQEDVAQAKKEQQKIKKQKKQSKKVSAVKTETELSKISKDSEVILEKRLSEINNELVNQYFKEDISVLMRDNGNYRGFKEINQEIKDVIKACLPEKMSDELKEKITFGKFINQVDVYVSAVVKARNNLEELKKTIPFNERSDNSELLQLTSLLESANKKLLASVHKIIEETVLHKSKKQQTKPVSSDSAKEEKNKITTADELSNLLNDALGDR